MPRHALAPTLALLLASSAMPALAADPPPPSRAAPSNQMAQLLASARMWEAKNRADMARGVLEKALLIDPDQPEALKLMGLIEIRSNRAAEAEKLLKKLQAVAPGSAATLELDDAYRIATRDKREMANIRLLSRSGKDVEAVQRLQKLFPRGAPAGSLARDYYRILAGTPEGRAAWEPSPDTWLGCMISPDTVKASQANAVIAAMICGGKQLQQYASENW